MRFDITLTGTRPLLMHNARLADPLSPYTQAVAEITGKRKKTLDDHREIALREWRGGLYYSDELGPYIPGENLERMLVDSAKITRDGQNIKRGVVIHSDECPLQYDGPRDVRKLAGDENFRLMAMIRTPSGRVSRCRPRFADWSLEAYGYLDVTILSPEDFQAIVERSGRLVGLGDWRPRYGRFTAAVRFTPEEGEA